MQKSVWGSYVRKKPFSVRACVCVCWIWHQWKCILLVSLILSTRQPSAAVMLLIRAHPPNKQEVGFLFLVITLTPVFHLFFSWQRCDPPAKNPKHFFAFKCHDSHGHESNLLNWESYSAAWMRDVSFMSSCCSAAPGHLIRGKIWRGQTSSKATTVLTNLHRLAAELMRFLIWSSGSYLQELQVFSCLLIIKRVAMNPYIEEYTISLFIYLDLSIISFL